MEHSFHEVTTAAFVAVPRIEARFLIQIARMRLWAENGLRLPDVDVRFVMTMTAAEIDGVPVVHKPVYYADDTELKISNGDTPTVFVLLNKNEHSRGMEVLRGCCRIVGVEKNDIETFARETMSYKTETKTVDILKDLHSFEEKQKEESKGEEIE